MFNFLFDNIDLFIISLVSFFIIFLVRKLFIKRCLYIFIYYSVLVLMFSFFALAGSSVIGDAYERMDQFKLLEESKQLDDAKKHLEKFNSMFVIDLKSFKNSAEFEEYIQQHADYVYRVAASTLGMICVILTELVLLIGFRSYTFYRSKLRNY